MVIDTQHHTTFDGHSTKPELACQGLCKKVWWHSDMKNRPQGICQLCGGQLIPAIEKKHYTVIAMANRPLKASDFTAHSNPSHKDKQFIKDFIKNGRGIDNLSVVKKTSEQLARETWCNPDLHGESLRIH